jgi:hypothetical protein
VNQDLQTILDEFTQAASLQRFDPEASLPHALLIDRKWVVNITEEDARLVLYASPGMASSTPRRNQELELQWFYLSASEDGSSMRVGLHASSGQVILHAAAEATTLKKMSLRSWLDDFINQMEIWADMLAPTADGAPVSKANAVTHPENHQLLSRDWLRG